MHISFRTHNRRISTRTRFGADVSKPSEVNDHLYGVSHACSRADPVGVRAPGHDLSASSIEIKES